MIFLFINKRKIFVYTIEELKKHQIDIQRLPYIMLGAKGRHDLVAQITGERSEIDNLLLFTNHNPRKIDNSVPQSWFKEQTELHGGVNPRAMWSYEDPSKDGEPLWVKDVIEEAKKIIWEAIDELVAETMDMIITPRKEEDNA